jgi:hypothetical protein
MTSARLRNHSPPIGTKISGSDCLKRRWHIGTLERLLARAGSFRHLETIEVAIGSHEKLSRAEADTLEAELERALPSTKLVVAWDGLLTRNSTAPSNLPAPVDSQSRDKNGSIDALGGWISGERR